jgi:hypothetical protein
MRVLGEIVLRPQISVDEVNCELYSNSLYTSLFDLIYITDGRRETGNSI